MAFFTSSIVKILALLLLFSGPHTPTSNARTPLRIQEKENQKVVILISSDGFRFGYQHKTSTPNIHRLIEEGTEARTGLIPIFPTITFPNHYSIVTGLYPPYHGIINNRFPDPITGETFTTSNVNPKWWLGEPIWQTVVDQGYNAAVIFWPGAEVTKGSWTCPKQFCPKYNKSITFEDRVDLALGYLDLPESERPVFIGIYFSDPDSQGHKVGPDHPSINEAVARIDSVIGRLIDGLEKRGIFDDINVIMLGDHGMVGTCDQRVIFLDDLSPWITIQSELVKSITPLLAITPPNNVSASEVVSKMNEGLSSNKVENGKYLKMYLKEDLPERLHYADSYRIPPIIGLLGEGFKVELERSKSKKECAGAHGYDNAFFSMRTIFMARGPSFAQGRKVESFKNVEIYNVLASVLGLKGAPNNGSISFANSILSPEAD
ncbi:Ectonucleotide pyrophosphatase/phosphodiesterase family member 3 [Rhynchospora pubera]|uniref:Ectonucleotide pyrophosphatase/phosphodiesterase family member 3 n=1 Tax=Rhynchospora pubera TaxID=906938 RepID=A0AAV8E0G9_9POAL|nr:Ectonucleotide pyrophosphatase/phosphodiesterase family member 3 [Rhynchospora pubera]